jgi:type II secretory pathway pseudopilin PulG
MHFYRKLAGKGIFSLMELTIVVVLLGVVSAIVAPRMSRGGDSPRVGEQVLEGQLRALRGAIDAYAEDHGGYWPHGDASRITRQLTEFTDDAGQLSVIRTPAFRFGPYLREIPPLPIGMNRGVATVKLPTDGRDSGWVYDPATGQIHASARPNERDTSGRAYLSY